jgi:hypothetical protein
MAGVQMESQPSKFNPALEAMNIFIGEWETEISAVRDNPSMRVQGNASFDWTEGGAFVRLQAGVPNSPFPSQISLMGPDDSAGAYCMLYFDSRGVSRIYQMSLDNGVWKLWRDFPEFSQRFTAKLSEDNTILDGDWAMSTDGKNWVHDFNIKYRKINKP